MKCEFLSFLGGTSDVTELTKWYSRKKSLKKGGPYDSPNVYSRPARVRFPAESGILISVLGLSVCPLSVFCPVLSLAEALTLC